MFNAFSKIFYRLASTQLVNKHPTLLFIANS